jgi:hypothetical protein
MKSIILSDSSLNRCLRLAWGSRFARQGGYALSAELCVSSPPHAASGICVCNVAKYIPLKIVNVNMERYFMYKVIDKTQIWMA